jgi:hypothetical protein
MELPGTLVQELIGVQLKVEPEQVVVHIVVAWAGGVIPVDAASATTIRRPARINSLRISFLPSELSQYRQF